ncbi:chromosome partitioning protein [Paenibacillus sp. yr247]|uniref:ParA family protein n=1 Tax=Paenibacillus sp. yr247 TaxID=1761880 RepID=UPI00088AB015|nr:AAA family ATPase [Paenibacillus sp. yr247]SDO56890.1 chromosome partitioning protein [Paenibacillus sp. yr247]
MSNVISIINLKGGVGKTTITVALAEFLAVEHQKRVLVIDLDPQTNSTVALIGEEEWELRNQNSQTLHALFKDHIDDTYTFEIDKSIVRKASNLRGGLDNLHLLPSSLDFVKIQDRLINIWQTALIRPFDVLKNAVQNHLDNYDFVLIDCPPNLGIVTQNGLNISNWYLIPTIPDHLSTYGIPQIISSVKNFNRKKADGEVKLLGVVASMYRSTVNRHNATLRQLELQVQQGQLTRLFETKVPLASRAADATYYEVDGINTLKQKYGNAGDHLYASFQSLAEEFLTYVKI